MFAGVLLLCLFALDIAVRFSHQKVPLAAAADNALRNRLSSNISFLSDQNNRMTHQGQWRTAEWLTTRVQEMGYETWTQEYTGKGKSWPNVIAAKSWPLDTTQKVIVLMAHFDAISGDRSKVPGADDDGSGVAVLLELARSLKSVETDLPIVFCLFSNEEVDIPGSKAFVRWAKDSGLDIQAAINLEVLGYNQPARLFDWDTVMAQAWKRAKLLAIWKQIKNGIKSISEGRDVILVAGKVQNRALVEAVGSALQEEGALKIIKQARDDCG